MFRNTLYYRVKPLIPASVRMGVRRWFAARQRYGVSRVWPILPGSERAPENWPGWPEGKQFALVLTHDVESVAGLRNSADLAKLESSLGFRSSFNFIPEGDYRVGEDLRSHLSHSGFEVGVHDLHHNGRLYRSRSEFKLKAARINSYLSSWGAVGFRSGFMLHNLDWLHELEIEYDASTFDTDPFEPQPQGKHTLFPFWVPRPACCAKKHQGRNGPEAGYLELPYTLPQDSTLFLLLRERHPDIWFEKLDWIARNGGMALVNVHPDYIWLGQGEPPPRTYPAEMYSRFLQYANQRYGGKFWQPLPREMSDYARELKPRLPSRPKRVCMVSYSYIKSDARVTRYAEALADRGHHVEVLGLKRDPAQPRREALNNIKLVNLQPRLGKKEVSRISYLLPILRFAAGSSWWIACQHLRKRYDLLHIHNVPDFLVFAAWLPKLTGTKVVLDIHDIVPEFYASKFSAPEDSRVIRWLKRAEKFSARFADHVIISNHLWHEKYSSRTGANGKCSVFINNVDTRVFYRRPRTRNDGKLIVLFPGGLQWHQGLDIAIRAFRGVADRLPQAEFHIYGEGNMKPNLVALARESGLEDKVRFFDPLPVNEIADVMANADLGVVPKRADSFGNEAYSTKIMEFLALGIPVVVSSTRIDRYYFNDTVVRFFESGNERALTEALLELLEDGSGRQRLSENAAAYVKENGWDTRKQDYLDLVSFLSGVD